MLILSQLLKRTTESEDNRPIIKTILENPNSFLLLFQIIISSNDHQLEILAESCLKHYYFASIRTFDNLYLPFDSATLINTCFFPYLTSFREKALQNPNIYYELPSEFFSIFSNIFFKNKDLFLIFWNELTSSLQTYYDYILVILFFNYFMNLRNPIDSIENYYQMILPILPKDYSSFRQFCMSNERYILINIFSFFSEKRSQEISIGLTYLSFLSEPESFSPSSPLYQVYDSILSMFKIISLRCNETLSKYLSLEHEIYFNTISNISIFIHLETLDKEVEISPSPEIEPISIMSVPIEQESPNERECSKYIFCNFNPELIPSTNINLEEVKQQDIQSSNQQLSFFLPKFVDILKNNAMLDPSKVPLLLASLLSVIDSCLILFKINIPTSFENNNSLPELDDTTLNTLAQLAFQLAAITPNDQKEFNDNPLFFYSLIWDAPNLHEQLRDAASTLFLKLFSHEPQKILSILFQSEPTEVFFWFLYLILFSPIVKSNEDIVQYMKSLPVLSEPKEFPIEATRLICYSTLNPENYDILIPISLELLSNDNPIPFLIGSKILLSVFVFLNNQKIPQNIHDEIASNITPPLLVKILDFWFNYNQKCLSNLLISLLNFDRTLVNQFLMPLYQATITNLNNLISINNISTNLEDRDNLIQYQDILCCLISTDKTLDLNPIYEISYHLVENEMNDDFADAFNSISNEILLHRTTDSIPFFQIIQEKIFHTDITTSVKFAENVLSFLGSRKGRYFKIFGNYGAKVVYYCLNKISTLEDVCDSQDYWVLAGILIGVLQTNSITLQDVPMLVDLSSLLMQCGNIKSSDQKNLLMISRISGYLMAISAAISYDFPIFEKITKTLFLETFENIWQNGAITNTDLRIATLKYLEKDNIFGSVIPDLKSKLLKTGDLPKPNDDVCSIENFFLETFPTFYRHLFVYEGFENNSD